MAIDLVTQLCGCSLSIPSDAAQAADILVCHGYSLRLCLGCRHSGLSWLLPASVFRGFLYMPVPTEEDGKSKRELVATEVNKHSKMDDSNLQTHLFLNILM